MGKKDVLKGYLDVAGVFSTAAGIIVAILLYSMRYEALWVWYEDLRNWLIGLENQIVQITVVWEFIAAILLLYLIKCFVPIYTTSTVCFLTGVVLPIYLAIPVNVLGLCIQFTGKYCWGKYWNAKRGPGLTWRWIIRNPKLWSMIESEGNETGDPRFLAISRLIPCTPVNTISSVYGYLGYDLKKYLLLSFAGYLPRLISFTFVGRNMFDPLSSAFLVPIMTIFILGGIGCFIARWVWNTVEIGKEKIPEYISATKLEIEKRKQNFLKNDKVNDNKDSEEGAKEND